MTPIDFNGLDTTVHGPIRLGVMTALQIDGPLSFTTVKKRLEARAPLKTPGRGRLYQQ
jgi:hypothetical protein